MITEGHWLPDQGTEAKFMPREQSRGKADFGPESEDMQKEKAASLDEANVMAGKSLEEGTRTPR